MENADLNLRALLAPLDGAVAEVAETWQPQSIEYRADVLRQIMMQLSYGYFGDDIYLYCPISSEYSYRISGSRGTVRILTLTTQRSLPGLPWDNDLTGAFYNDIDDADLDIAADGDFELLLSTERPAGYEGNWLRIVPGARVLMTRHRSTIRRATPRARSTAAGMIAAARPRRPSSA